MFEGKRILLRKLTIEDHKIYNVWQNYYEVMNGTSPLLDKYSLSDSYNFIEMILNQQNAKGYIIETKDNKVISIVSLINIDYKNSNAELIIDIGDKSMWNKGIGSEALQVIINYSFLELNLHKIYLQVFSFNENAIRLYEKMGFSIEGRCRDTLFRNGVYHDTIQMGILKHEYFEKQKLTK